MIKAFRSFVSFMISFTLFCPQAFAQSSSYLGVGNFDFNRGAEYTSGNQPGTVLMRVNLWGAVQRPGIHNIPVKSGLMELVSYAGGPTADAKLKEVTIKRELGKSRKLIKVNVDELVRGVSHHHLELSPNDIVVIPRDKPLVDNDTLTVVGLVSIIMSTVLSAVLIDQNSRN